MDDIENFLKERMIVMETARQDMIDILVDRLAEWQGVLDDPEEPEGRRTEARELIERYTEILDSLEDFVGEENV